MPLDSATTADTTLAELEALGTEKHRTVYRRHGVGGAQFGVSYAHIRTLAKRIGRDHLLASALWASGNHDARVLATLVAHPPLADEALLDTWAADLDSYVLTDAFSDFAAQTGWAQRKRDAWIDSDGEWTESAGWNLLARDALRSDGRPDDFFAPYLDRIERTIHSQKNRVRHAMNNALIAIGTRNDALAELATAAAERIGRVDVDHGATNCTTPDAAAYIAKTRDRQRARAAKR